MARLIKTHMLGRKPRRAPTAISGVGNPLVSVVIPAYNAARFLREAVSSVAGQDYRPLELVVVDDASTDDTVAVAEGLREQLKQSGIELVLLKHQQNEGAAQALSWGFSRAGGVFVAWLSADDAFCASWKLSRQVSFMQRNGCGVSFYRTILQGPESDDSMPSTGFWVSPKLRWLDRFVEASPARALVALWFGNPINGSSSMIRRAVYERAGGFDPILRNVDADADLWMRCLALGFSIRGITGAPVFYRIHRAQTSQADPLMANGTQATRVRMIHGLSQKGLLTPILEGAWVVLWLRTIGRAVEAWPSPAREIVRHLDTHQSASKPALALASRMRRQLARLPVESHLRADRVEALAHATKSAPAWQNFLASLKARHQMP